MSKKVVLRQTARAWVYELADDPLSKFKVSKEDYSSVVSNLGREGLCILQSWIPDSSQSAARVPLSTFILRLLSSYNFALDEFSLDLASEDVVRLPRIGRGKHNVHFDPELSDVSRALAELADSFSLAAILSRYFESIYEKGAKASFRECGVSVTRPASVPPSSSSSSSSSPSPPSPPLPSSAFQSTFATDAPDPRYGEGMEWHSDGPKGECTVLLALDDVRDEQGCLRCVPGSHDLYVEGLGHPEEFIKGNLGELGKRQIEYCYKKGNPMVIDARTLHSVAPNRSDSWRVVIWYIFDCYRPGGA